MKYIEFKIGDKDLAIEVTDDFSVEPTLINKIGPALSNDGHSEYIDGLINYRGKMVDVIDIAPIYNQEKLKKFDGLIFINNQEVNFALKYEGFHRISSEYSGKIINLNDLIKKVEN